MALDVWPSESPHWRLAGAVLPEKIQARRLQQELSSDEAVSAGARASMLQALCNLRPRTVLSLAESVAEGLAWKLSLEELSRCLAALAAASWHPLPKESKLQKFAEQGVERTVQGARALTLEQLVTAHAAASTFGFESQSLAAELRRRVLRVAGNQSDGSLGGRSCGPVGTFVAAAQVLQETAALRSRSVREAMLPGTLSVSDANEVLRHALPKGDSWTPAHEFLVSLAVRPILQARRLPLRQTAATLRSVIELQAFAHPFALDQAAKLLRRLWPRVADHLPYLGPKELADVLCAYWWQLLYSHQETATPDQSNARPLPGSLTGAQAIQELSAKLLRPVLENLHELPLKQVTSCLTALAPPVKPPDVMTQSDRALLQDALRRVFQGDGRSSATLAQAEVLTEAWMQDFCLAELRELSDAELLELACGLREAQLELGSFPMDFVMEDLNIRLRRKKDEVELSHFLLLRMCRVMDLWYKHEVEAVLRKLLSNPEALTPLPTAYFAGLLSALSSFPVPKDLPLRLTAAFLDRSELGEVVATPEQWATMLCSLRHLDEPFFERITPRLLQQLLPHLQGLSDGTLLRVLDALAKAPPKESPESSSVNSPLEQAPAAFNAAIAEATVGGRSVNGPRRLTFDWESNCI
ncbi:Hypothetical protein SCF082_LOCUS18829 [Durusdinium trenchii]|uniref:Uncharacterized protein n=1 Tax=Durusdinium trenchii TaxID=1381693 RepID=A0ABP0KRN5_9DINO